MRRFMRGKPSPAMAVALVALSAALVGTAIAGPTAVVSLLDKGEKKQVKKISKKQANKQIKKKAPGLSVANAQHANNADNADNANNADKATDATNATNATNAENAENAATVGGNHVVKIAYRSAGTDGANDTVLDLSGLQMKADCDGTNATITADTTVADAFIWWTTNRDFGDPLYSSFADFDPGEPQNLAVGKTPRSMGGEIRYTTPANRSSS